MGAKRVFSKKELELDRLVTWLQFNHWEVWCEFDVQCAEEYSDRPHRTDIPSNMHPTVDPPDWRESLGGVSDKVAGLITRIDWMLDEKRKERVR